jgi:chemotaxis protein methyltransferase CheR
MTSTDLQFLFDYVYKRSAIVLTQDKAYLVETRLGPVARSQGLRSVEELVAALRARPAASLETMVVEAMTTNETTFFRDHHPFEALTRDILPALIKRRAAGRSLVFWSAACSTGQEAYSIAMLLKERFPELDGWNVRIVGLDLAQGVLARAREGVYHQVEVNRGLPAALLVKYFDRIGTDWQIRKAVRDRVEFRHMNLVEPWPGLPQPDVLFLRNVLIYFDVATKKAVLGRAHATLAPDGYLLLGGAETTLNVDDRFERVTLERCVVYRPSGAR